MGEHGSVTHELVHHVGLRGVERLCVMADVLRRVEHFEGESVQELTLGEEATHGFEAPASARAEEIGDIV